MPSAGDFRDFDDSPFDLSRFFPPKIHSNYICIVIRYEFFLNENFAEDKYLGYYRQPLLQIEIKLENMWKTRLNRVLLADYRRMTWVQKYAFTWTIEWNQHWKLVLPRLHVISHHDISPRENSPLDNSPLTEFPTTFFILAALINLTLVRCCLLLPIFIFEAFKYFISPNH